VRLDLLGGGGHIPSGAPGPSVEAVRRRFGHRSSWGWRSLPCSFSFPACSRWPACPTG